VRRDSPRLTHMTVSSKQIADALACRIHQYTRFLRVSALTACKTGPPYGLFRESAARVVERMSTVDQMRRVICGVFVAMDSSFRIGLRFYCIHAVRIPPVNLRVRNATRPCQLVHCPRRGTSATYDPLPADFVAAQAPPSLSTRPSSRCGSTRRQLSSSVATTGSTRRRMPRMARPYLLRSDLASGSYTLVARRSSPRAVTASSFSVPFVEKSVDLHSLAKDRVVRHTAKKMASLDLHNEVCSTCNRENGMGGQRLLKYSGCEIARYCTARGSAS